MYKENFLECMKMLNDIEGVFSNDPDDSGGKTKYGITEATAKSVGYKGRIEDLSKEDAERIYYLYYWKPCNLDALESFELQLLLFLFSVNKTNERSIKALQMGFNLINFKEKYGEDLVCDGILGPKTAKAVNQFEEEDRRLAVAVVVEIASYYRNITKRNEVLRKYYYGWLSKRLFL